MAKKDSQENLYEHSEVKVKLLGTYLERYLNILNHSKHVGDVHYFDMFSAEGIYENEGEGSPIIVLKAIKDSYYAKKTVTGASGKFHVMFNDIDETKIQKLQKNVIEKKLHYSEIGNLSYKTEDYKKLLPVVKESIETIGKNEKAFVFIDPYGYKEIRISDIKGLLENKKTEVLLFLPTHFMFRFSENGTPESLIEFIDELVPVEKWPKSKTGLDFVHNLKQGFKNYLGDDYFVDSFAISRDKNQFFCLFFFTSHIYGFDKMIDAKWNLDEEDGRGWKYNAKNDLFSQMEKTPNTENFEKTLRDFIKVSKTNAELYEFTLRKGHKPAHAVDILKKWQIEGVLEVLKKDGTKARKKSFYLNYPNFKVQPDKVNIKLIN